MRVEKGPGESASTPLSFCPGDMDYIQVVDIVFLGLVRTMGAAGKVDYKAFVQSVLTPAAIPSFQPN